MADEKASQIERLESGEDQGDSGVLYRLLVLQAKVSPSVMVRGVIRGGKGTHSLPTAAEIPSLRSNCGDPPAAHLHSSVTGEGKGEGKEVNGSWVLRLPWPPLA